MWELETFVSFVFRHEILCHAVYLKKGYKTQYFVSEKQKLEAGAG